MHKPLQLTVHPQLTALESELREATIHAARVVSPLADSAFGRRPEPTRWSVAECLTHLNLTTRAFLPRIDSALEVGRVLGLPAPARFRLDFIGWLLCWINEPPYRQRIKTAAPFVPFSTGSRDDVLAEFRGLQEELADRIRAAEGLDLTQLQITSPFEARMHYHLYSCFRILAAHQRRHLWQAEQVTFQLRGAA